MNNTIDFMGKRKIAAAFSIILLLASITSLGVKGLALGLDFTGGTLVEVEYQEAPNLEEVREQLLAAGYEKLVVQNFGAATSVLVRLSESFNDKVGAQVASTLSANGVQLELTRAEFVGAQVGEELREQGGIGLLLALGLVMFYVAVRFQFKFSVGAVSALIHDVIIVIGAFSILGWDFDLTVLAALLAVIGYSLNDTIVVSDRIRENFRKLRKSEPDEVINISLTQTLSRTLVTSATTLLVLFALYFLGGEMINGFAKALLIGVLVGTYSSIYVASNVLLSMGVSKEDLIAPVVEDEEGNAIDDQP
ncbi:MULTISPECIES: protein translocase subunit SecF [unclassified Oleiphilus]|uniref:protein translocase subunit SecF n=1 Tax=unclassified Oleiphilus TaxID=2631174 RepID=UPI0007C404BB|nr:MULTISPECIES: protein translocase subunit SecF [unclassified Oleiphilus]KZY44359.1 preprotein translocase subunit SecF [Oleiphilus sp. HI0050]KZY80514.1 preprotein translocase subunit SecF [Oleiphilus sp. HI0068]KZY81366.1 preprotein translocase subunit SecF [Oleiphilus sp. HI0069]KZY96977.1 preprotein translocase subunit SecF [Oleiphilus sp. HI0072]KZZ21547.1 preprotein translocase subunit SecF [Oleiphilus sp. HI0078]KZZ47138.1 preprotein translocase subunit SecF [Oleiphilus sp. HI0085]